VIRRAVPDAELRIFYRIDPWLQGARELPTEVGRRARYIEEVLPKLADFGVQVVGQVPNAQMARELQEATVLAYPCDPVRYTEGFGCSVLDAAAAGCIPVISDADALPSVHRDAALVVKGRPAEATGTWVDVIGSLLMLKGGARDEWKGKMANHARKHSRHAIADKWEEFLR
jgi:glycosyltransferase involved in cell wall biosynthesis